MSSEEQLLNREESYYDLSSVMVLKIREVKIYRSYCIKLVLFFDSSKEVPVLNQEKILRYIELKYKK